MKHLILILTFILFSLFAKANEKNFFNEAKGKCSKNLLKSYKTFLNNFVIYGVYMETNFLNGYVKCTRKKFSKWFGEKL